MPTRSHRRSSRGHRRDRGDHHIVGGAHRGLDQLDHQHRRHHAVVVARARPHVDVGRFLDAADERRREQ